jgi:hypothetical protein
MAYHEYFEPQLIELRKELEYHPDLMTILKLQESPDIYVHIAEIAAYCNVLLDGTYSKEDILEICEICTKKLHDKREIIVKPFL